MSKAGKKSKVPELVNWDEGLVKDDLKIEGWEPFIAFISPSVNVPQSEATLAILNSAIETGCRRRFFTLNKESMLISAKSDAKLAMASAGGGRKSKQGNAANTTANKPLYVEVCEHVVSEMNTPDGVNNSLLARLLKYNIIKLRTKFLADKEAQAKEKVEAPVKGKGGSAKGKGGGAAGRASKKGKATPANDGEDLPMPEKPPTTMKKRGEEDKESKYIDDEPPQGPTAYIVVSGFDETDMFVHLAKVGINIHSLVKINNTVTPVTTDINDPEVDDNEEEKEKIQARSVVLEKFWSTVNLSSFLNDATIEDTAMLDLTIDALPDTADIEANKQFGLDVFSQLSVMLYDVLKSQKQYQHYLHYLDILQVQSPVVSFESQSDVRVVSASHERKQLPDMRYYNEQLNKIPEDLVTPAVILECMLQQVVQSSSDAVPDTSVALHKDLQMTFSDILSDIASSTSEAKSESNIKVINRLDKANISCRKVPQLTSTNTLNQSRSLLSSLTQPPSIDLFDHEVLLHETQLHSLRQFITDVPQLQIDSVLSSLLGILSMEHITPPNVNEEPLTDLSITPSHLLFDYPLDLGLKDLHLSGSTSLVPSEANNPIPQDVPQLLQLDLPDSLVDLSDYTIIEPLSSDVMLQVIQSYQQSHPYIRLHQHKLTKSTIVALYSGYTQSIGRAGKHSWQKHIHTRVGFNNYLKYIAKRVGRDVDEAFEEDKERKAAIEVERAEIMAKRQKERLEAEKTEAASILSSAKSGKTSKKSSAKKPPSSKSNKQETASTIGEDVITDDLPTFNERKLYTGYNIGRDVILSNGTLSKAFTSDGVVISCECGQIVNKPILMTVSLTHKDVVLSAIISKDVTPRVRQDVEEDKEEDQSPVEIDQPPQSTLYCGFQGNLSNEITMSFSHYGPVGNGVLPFQPNSLKELMKLKQQARPESSQSSSRPQSQDKKLTKKQQEDQQRLAEQQQLLEAKLAESKQHLLKKITSEREAMARCNKYQQLNLTTFQGLHITCLTLVANDGKESLAVTQEFNIPPSQLGKEKSRVYLSDGTVIKKSIKDSISILCNDGTIFETIPVAAKESYDGLFAGIEATHSATKVSFVPEEHAIAKESFYDHYWLVTLPDGRKEIMRYIMKPPLASEEEKDVEEDGNSEENKVEGEGEGSSKEIEWITETIKLSPISTHIATDPKSKEILMTREDNVMILKRPDGSMIVEHADGTRITSSSSSIILEHPFFAMTTCEGETCTLNVTPDVDVECLSKGQYNIKQSAKNYNISIESNGEVTYTSNDKGTYKIDHTNHSQVLTGTDSSSITYTADANGDLSVSNDTNANSTIPIDFLPHFIVIGPDGMSYEIHHAARYNALLDSLHQSANPVMSTSNEANELSSTTVLYPCFDERLLPRPYQLQTIIPTNLQGIHSQRPLASPSSSHPPPSQPKPFGVGVGKALSIGEFNSPKPVVLFKEPEYFQYRHFMQPIAPDLSLRDTFKHCLVKYLEWRQEKERLSDELLPVTTNTIEQQKATQNLQEKVASFNSLPSSEALLEHYTNSLKDKVDSPPPPRESSSNFIAAMENLREDIAQAKTTRETIKNGVFPPYFQSPDGIDYLRSQSPNMKTLADKCPPLTKHSTIVTFDKTTEITSKATEDNESSPIAPAIPQASLYDISSGSEKFSSTISLSKSRPSNPTPLRAEGDQSLPNDRQVTQVASMDGVSSAPNIHQQSYEEIAKPVKLPQSITGSRPGEVPNVKYSTVEEPVRRKVRTSSTALHKVIRGFELTPSDVNFGILQEGSTYSTTCTLRNVGIDTCGFKIKHLPPSTGIKVHYSPGLVVAGMSRKFRIELFALAAGATSPVEIGNVRHELEIITETSILHLPIRAYIYPLALFNQSYNSPLAGAMPNIQLVHNQLQSRENTNRHNH